MGRAIGIPNIDERAEDPYAVILRTFRPAIRCYPAVLSNRREANAASARCTRSRSRGGSPIALPAGVAAAPNPVSALTQLIINFVVAGPRQAVAYSPCA